jgi:hypothetical protein
LLSQQTDGRTEFFSERKTFSLRGKLWRKFVSPAIDDPRRSEFFLHLSASAYGMVFEIKKQQSPIGPLPRQPQQTPQEVKGKQHTQIIAISLFYSTS